ncbi:hypothetical protein K9M47_00425 [Candidatus Gracilibacteria bacterium]|nr:hypothetical protein [Candidatus Gracilibacteria bacterium]
MILSTHAIVGTIIATTFTSNPYIAFSIGFASHFILDPIPHWDYKLHSFKKDLEGKLNHDMVLGKTFIVDLMRVGTDAMLGMIISFIIALYVLKVSTLQVILASVIGGILPDPLQFVYWKTRSKLLLPLQKFHTWIHGRSLDIHPIYGVPLQILVVLVFLSVSLIIKK